MQGLRGKGREQGYAKTFTTHTHTHTYVCVCTRIHNAGKGICPDPAQQPHL